MACGSGALREGMPVAYSIYGADGKEYGPVEPAVLAQWAREGRVVERTEVLDHASGRRFLACDLEDLATVFRTPTDQYYLASPSGAYMAAPGVNQFARKNRMTAGLLGIFLGWLGVHRFYLGYTAIGVVQLLMSTLLALFTCGATLVLAALWGVVEGILCLTGTLTDANGLPLAD